MFWCLGFEGRRIISREVKGCRVSILEETSGGEKERFRVSGLFYPEVVVAEGSTGNPARRAFWEGALSSVVDSITIEFFPKSKFFSWQHRNFWVVPLAGHLFY